MGCDMHAILEEKTEDGRWEMVKEYDINREYAIFANLANVRNPQDKIKPISQPKGWPDDLSLGGLRFKEFWGSDAHGCSYLFPSELRKHIWRGYSGNELTLPDFIGDMMLYHESDDVRLVFCFDN